MGLFWFQSCEGEFWPCTYLLPHIPCLQVKAVSLHTFESFLKLEIWHFLYAVGQKKTNFTRYSEHRLDLGQHSSQEPLYPWISPNVSSSRAHFGVCVSATPASPGIWTVSLIYRGCPSLSYYEFSSSFTNVFTFLISYN